jgi:hypothetical protein
MTNTVQSVWKKVNRRGPDECWPWLGPLSIGKRGGGYGRLDVQNHEGVYAHRVAYIAANPDSISLDCKDGVFVLHKCDNPACCNPKHLYLGDHAQNMSDKVVRGRSKLWDSTTESPNAKFSEDDVRWIRFMHSQKLATNRALALLYEVSRAAMHSCLYGRTYQDIKP